MKKRLIALFLCISACLSSVAFAADTYSPYATENVDMAMALYQLGLFKGKRLYSNGDPDFALNDTATRLEGLVMLIRLLGEEEEALAYEGICPFTDVPKWGERYAAYAYAKGYTKGTSATTFTPNDTIEGGEYSAFLLRALGYEDVIRGYDLRKTGDFFAKLVGIDEQDVNGWIGRDTCVKCSYLALSVKLRNSNLTLIEKLVRDGKVSEQAVRESGILSGDARIYGGIPVQLWTEDQAVFYLLATLPDESYAYRMKNFKAKVAQMDAMGGSACYPDEYEEIDLDREYTNFSEFENHTNAEVRQFIEDYIRNFDPSFLFADHFPEAPEGFRHDIELWHTVDYDKPNTSIYLGRAYWRENLNVLRFCAILPETPGDFRDLLRKWQMGTVSSESVKNSIDCWIAVGGIYKNFKIVVQ